MIEEDLKYYKEQYELKDKEYKELAKESIMLNKQNTSLSDELKKEERQNTENIKKLTEKFEKENKALLSKISNNQSSTTQITKVGWGNSKCYSEEEFNRFKAEWIQESSHLKEKIELMKEQNNKNSTYNEELMLSYKSLEKSNFHTQESNWKLSEIVEKNDFKIQELEKRNNKLKVYK